SPSGWLSLGVHPGAPFLGALLLGLGGDPVSLAGFLPLPAVVLAGARALAAAAVVLLAFDLRTAGFARLLRGLRCACDKQRGHRRGDDRTLQRLLQHSDCSFFVWVERERLPQAPVTSE